METIITFYWPNIIAGILLVFTLGLFGRHLVGRNQSMEIMLLGQEFKTSILIASILATIIESGEHTEHSIHLETIVALLCVAFFHFCYYRLIKKRAYKIEGAIVFITILIALDHLIVLFSPLVEFHMIKSALGDIVTVSKVESFFVIVSTILIALFYNFRKKEFNKDTLEIALFNKRTKKSNDYYFFNLSVMFLMLVSIHLFGTIFTVGALIIPALITSYFNLSTQKFNALNCLNSLMVIVSFMILTLHDRLPSTVIIIILITITSIAYSFMRSQRK